MDGKFLHYISFDGKVRSEEKRKHPQDMNDRPSVSRGGLNSRL